MSRGVVIPPVLSRSGFAKIAQPPPIRRSSVVLSPVCRKFSGTQTATPGVVGS